MTAQGRKTTVSGVLAFALVIYASGYFAYRLVHTEVWPDDGKAYVVFPDDDLGRLAYYGWRPMSYLDARFMGVQTHLGPHQPAQTAAVEP